MAKQDINIGDTGQQLVNKLGNNFTELYNRMTARGVYTLQVKDGILYFISDDGTVNPFEYDEETGILYYLLEE